MKISLLFLFICLTILATISYGQVPRRLSYQGLLTTAIGAPVTDGNYDMTFKVYTLPTGGTLRYTESHTSVPVGRGTFNVILGSILPFTFTFTESLFVEITVDNGPSGLTYPVTFTSRTALTAAPYALGPWVPTDSSVTFIGNVGIGTSTPSQKLDVNGTTKTTNFRMTSGATNGFIMKTDSLGNASWVSPTIVATSADSMSLIIDADRNTKVQAGQNNDDKIHFTLGGTEYFTMNKGTLEVNNTSNCLFIGNAAGLSNNYITTLSNIGIGANALQNNITGSYNVAVGRRALQNSTVANNSAIGADAGRNITTGNNNTVFGAFSLPFNSSGANNVAIGASSGYYAQGSNNTYLGANAGYNNNGIGNVFIGDSAGYSEFGNSKLYIDNSSTGSPLLYGDFSAKHLTINDSLTSKYFQMKNGATNGYVLASDSNGNATWASPASLSGSGDNLGNHTATQNIKLNNHWLSNDGGNEGIYVDSAGKVGIGTSKPGHALDVYLSGDSTKYAIVGQAHQATGSGDYTNVGVAGFGGGVFHPGGLSEKGTEYGHTVGVMGIGDYSTSQNSIGVYAELGPQLPGVTSVTLNSALYANGASLGYAGIFVNGSVGIGLTAPTHLFDVAGGIAIGSSYAGGVIPAPTNGAIIQGAVGIGTSDPTTTLDVNGTIKSTNFRMTNSATSGYIMQSDASGNGSWVNPTTLNTSVWTTSGNNIYKNNSGNVGIGITSPQSLLHVYASTGNADSKVESATGHTYMSLSSTSGTEDAFLFQTTSSGYKNRWEFGKSIGAESGSNAGSDFFINRYADDGTYLSQPFTMTRSTGYVGINTSSQKSSFEVNGSVGMKVKTAQVAGTNDPDATGEFWMYSSGTGSITLPTASTCTNRMYVIVNQTGASRTISSYKDLTATAQTTIANSTSVWVVSDGTSWLQVK